MTRETTADELINEFGESEKEKCKKCGSRSVTYSTEQKDGSWIWKRLCASCNNVLETRDLKLSCEK